MPRIEHMTWHGSSKRWSKMYRGKTYYVSCRQLNCPDNKAESLDVANAWWIVKKAELDGQGTTTEQKMARLGTFLREATGMSLNGGVHDWGTALGTFFLANAQTQAVMKHVGTSPQQVASEVYHGTAEGETIRHWFGQWTEAEKTRMNTGKISANVLAYKTRHVEEFCKFVGMDKSAGSVNETTLDKFYKRLAESEYGGDRRRKGWINAKQFVEFLYERKQLDVLPRNFNSLEAFEIEQKDIKHWTPQQCKQLIEKAEGQTRLHILLMLNCGFTGKDIADLHNEEVDWKKGTINRKRSKTKKKTQLKVTFKLWPATFALLKEYRQEGDLVLRDGSGKPWKYDGTSKMAHVVAVIDACGFGGFPRMFRASSATMIGRQFGESIAQYFLAHAPQTVAGKHYLASDDDQLATATDWLRKKIFGR